jgi:hypothetical protein
VPSSTIRLIRRMGHVLIGFILASSWIRSTIGVAEVQRR